MRRTALRIALSVPPDRIYAPGMDPRFKGTDRYWADIFTPNPHQSDYSEAVWAIRGEWIVEADSIYKSGTNCKPCEIKRLTDKYTNKLKEQAGISTDPLRGNHDLPGIVLPEGSSYGT